MDWWKIKGEFLPPPHTRRVSRGGESAGTIVNGAHSECSPFVAQRAPSGCGMMTKAPRFRKKKSGRKLCKSGGSQRMTLPLNTVLLNGGEVWEQGNREGVLVPFLLAEPLAEIPAEAVAISPPQAAHGNRRAGARKPGGILRAAGGKQGTQTSRPPWPGPLSLYHPQGDLPLHCSV